jgi:hypothetical protein
MIEILYIINVILFKGNRKKVPEKKSLRKKVSGKKVQIGIF